MNFVWRQLRLAFFGALTSVGALFDFERRKQWKNRTKTLKTNNPKMKTKQNEPTFNKEMYLKHYDIFLKYNKELIEYVSTLDDQQPKHTHTKERKYLYT